MSTTLQPMHPGEILLEEFLKPMGLSRYRLAKDIGVRATRINQIVQGKAGVSADTALRLGRYFQMSAEFWINAQGHYDLERARDKLAKRLKDEVSIHVA